MNANKHPYCGLSLDQCIALLLTRDTRITQLEDGKFIDRQTIAEYRELIWGKKSEKHIQELARQQLDAAQQELSFADQPEIETFLSETAEQYSTVTKKQCVLRKLKPNHRKDLSSTGLPHEYVEILPVGYHEGMIRIDTQQTRELDYRPGSFFVRVISRPRFADPQTKSVVIAPMPARPIHKGIAGAGLLAYILTSRFCDHLPYYRQVKMLNRYGEKIVNTSTLGRWVKDSINLLSIIHSRIKEAVLSSTYLQGDETTIKVLDRHKEKGKHQGYIWGYHAPMEKLVFMEYAEGRAADYPLAFLHDFKGVFQTDAYAAYDKVLKDREDIVHACCWAHSRRNFFKSLVSDKKRATEALDMIRELYTVEAALKENAASLNKTLELREKQAVPALEKIKEWALEQLKTQPPKSMIAGACNYMLKRWEKLSYYTTDPRIQIDNNLLENRFRGTALGRKNWLFAGDHQSAERSAIIYSITESCALNKVDPYSYLKDVLIRLPYLLYAPKEKIDELLPSNWKPQVKIIFEKSTAQDCKNTA